MGIAAGDHRAHAAVVRSARRREPRISQAALSTPASRTVVAPNVDTLYSIAVVDLRDGPVVLHVPTIATPYWTYQFVDTWTDSFAYIGTRCDRWAQWYVVDRTRELPRRDTGRHVSHHRADAATVPARPVAPHERCRRASPRRGHPHGDDAPAVGEPGHAGDRPPGRHTANRGCRERRIFRRSSATRSRSIHRQPSATRGCSRVLRRSASDRATIRRPTQARRRELCSRAAWPPVPAK